MRDDAERADDEAYSLFVARPKLTELLADEYSVPEATISFRF